MRPLLFSVCLLLAACGSDAQKPPAVIQSESPADEVFRVSRSWQSTTSEKGLRSPPSKISVFEVRTQSSVRFATDPKAATEALYVEEHFEMQNGQVFDCRAGGEVQLAVTWGRRHGEAAIELARPSGVALARQCKPAGFPEAVFSPEGGSSRFVMRDDQLVAFAPPLEKRVYLPIE